MAEVHTGTSLVTRQPIKATDITFLPHGPTEEQHRRKAEVSGRITIQTNAAFLSLPSSKQISMARKLAFRNSDILAFHKLTVCYSIDIALKIRVT